MESNEQGATPESNPAQATPPATGTHPTTPQGTPGATPTIQPDTAAQITTLTGERDSANARIKELNNENKQYRLLKTFCDSAGITPEELKTRLESGDTALKENTERTKKDAFKKATSAAKTRVDGDLLASLVGALDVDYSTEGEGEEEIGYVTYKNGDKTEKKTVTEWVGITYPQLKDRLITSSGNQGQTVLPRHKGVPKGGGKQPSLAERIQEEEKQKRERANLGMNGQQRVTLKERLGRTR